MTRAALFCLMLMGLLLPTAGAAETGDGLLAKMDESMSRSIDQYFEYELINEEKGREPKVMVIEVFVKGPLRMTQFLAPGDMKGTKALVRSRSQSYIYLPAYKKVRRIASHMTSGGFLGTTFSNDDIATVVYGPVYSGALLSETEDSWTLTMTPKEGVKVAYGKLEMVLNKTYLQPTEIRYFNAKGAHIKTESRTGYSCVGDVCNAESMKMVDHTRNGASSELFRKKWKVNMGIDDSIFSVRSLQN